MSFVVDKYKEGFLHRYDKDGITPYYSCDDFKGLNVIEKTFKNSKNIEIHYYFYNREDPKENKIILFLPGIGPGHTAYLREINLLTEYGYKVLTLDYTGCDKSEGDSLYSLNVPTRDTVDLLNSLDLKEEVYVIGHSLGAYTAINVLKRIGYIKRGVVISGFLNVKKEMQTFIPFGFMIKPILKYEMDVEPEYYEMNQIEFLKNTEKRILFIHSTDDQMVSYDKNMAYAMKLKNENFSFITVNNRKHNPNYSEEAVKYMTETFTNLSKIESLDEKKEYMNSRSIDIMTEQDKSIFDLIVEHINK